MLCYDWAAFLRWGSEQSCGLAHHDLVQLQLPVAVQFARLNAQVQEVRA